MRMTRPLQSGFVYKVYQCLAHSQVNDVNDWYIAMKISAIYAHCPEQYDPKKEAQYYARVWAEVCRVHYDPFEGKTPEQLLLFARTVRKGVEYRNDLCRAPQEAKKK